jgi:hypothetical protein
MEELKKTSWASIGGAQAEDGSSTVFGSNLSCSKG